jgi:hypothetical protein
MHGHREGEFLGKPPTGKEFAAQQIHIWPPQEGKVIEHWSCRDDLAQALQLGLIGEQAAARCTLPRRLAQDPNEARHDQIQRTQAPQGRPRGHAPLAGVSFAASPVA